MIKSNLEEVKDYLECKVNKINPNNSKSNSGAIALYFANDWNSKSLLCCFIAASVIQAHFTRDTIECPAGKAKLTAVSTSIGERINLLLGLNITAWALKIRLGDLFIEAFLNTGHIRIYRDPGFSEHDAKAPYIIDPLPRWAKLFEIPVALERSTLVGTVFKKPNDIKDLMQPGGYPLIKNWSDDETQLFRSIVNSKAVRAINKLQQEGWVLNKELYDWILTVEEDMYHYVPPMPVLGSKDEVEKAYKKLKAKGGDTKENRDVYNKKSIEWNEKLKTLRATSKNTETRIIMMKAKALRDEDIFYQLLDLDYRGRVYPREHFLHYQSNDLARALLKFHKKKKLGYQGIEELFRYTACAYNETYNVGSIPTWCGYDYNKHLLDNGLDSISVDKMTLQDRSRWTEENLNYILSYTKGNKIPDCEDPFLFMACAFEIKNMLEASDPAEFESNLPIPIDGTCNGYQHSAAIAKDDLTASLVALTDTELPRDLYMEVAKVMIQDDTKGFFIARNIPLSDVRKGISKRGTMVRAYSAGKDKIRDNMFSDLYAYGMDNKYNITMLDCEYLSELLIKSINKVCPGATKTMKLLQDIVDYEMGTHVTYDTSGATVSKTRIRKVNTRLNKLRKLQHKDPSVLTEINELAQEKSDWIVRLDRGNGERSLTWEVDSGFKVLYGKYLTKKLECKSTISGLNGGATAQRGRITHVGVVNTDIPNRKELASGVAPNYIHSNDGSHLCITVYEWEHSFAAIHDSYSTHACDIPALKELTRKTFVDIYDKENMFEKIVNQILSDDSAHDIDIPSEGTQDITEVLGSTFFFS